MSQSEYYSNNAKTALTAGYTAGSGSITVTSTAGNFPTSVPFHVSIYDDTTSPPTLKVILEVTAITDSTHFAVTAEGTDANASSGNNVYQCLTKVAIDRIKTDAGYLGTPWQRIITDPNLTTFSWRNQGSATVTSHTGSIYLVTPAHSGINIVGREVSAPGSTPWSFVAGLQPLTMNVGNISAGIYVSDGTKLVNFGVGNGGGSSLFVAKYNSVTSFSVNYTTPNLVAHSSPIFLKVLNDGTNLKWFISPNGLDFFQIDSHTITDFLASASFIGFFVDSETASWPCGMSVVSWTQGTS